MPRPISDCYLNERSASSFWEIAAVWRWRTWDAVLSSRWRGDNRALASRTIHLVSPVLASGSPRHSPDRACWDDPNLKDELTIVLAKQVFCHAMSCASFACVDEQIG